MGVFPIGADAESIFCSDRNLQQQDFIDADRPLVSSALRGIKWFYRQLLLSYGLSICTVPLTDAERTVNEFLVAGNAEKAIASLPSLSPGTVPQYATRIYHMFGVRGRMEYMSPWLAGATASKSRDAEE